MNPVETSPRTRSRAIIWATALLGSSSVAAIGVQALAAKVWALCLGPAGFGVIGLEQALIRVAVIVAGAGLGPAMVCLGANAIASENREQSASLQRAAWWLSGLFAVLALIVITLWRVSFARWLLGGSAPASDLVWVGLALALTVVYTCQTSILNAHHEVSALARTAVIGTCLGLAWGMGVIWQLREAGIPLALFGIAAANCAVAELYLRHKRAHWPQSSHKPRPREIIAAAQALLQFGIPNMLSNLVGGGVLMSLPFLVLALLGTTAVGYYRAAAGITVVYLRFLLTAMEQDYFPRLAASSRNSEEIGALINEQHRVVMALATPLLVAAMALAPILIPLLFSAKFAPAIALFQWQLFGDAFKLSSWTVSYAILARAGSAPYLLNELIAGIVILGTSFVGAKLFGLDGFGIAYTASYIIYFFVTAAIFRKYQPFSLTSENRRRLAIAAAAVAAAGLAGWQPNLALRMSVDGGLVLATSLAAYKLLTGAFGPELA